MSKSKKTLDADKHKIKYEVINHDKAALSLRLEQFKKNGRKKIKTKEELEEFPYGSLISYMKNDGVFRSAGFIDKFEDTSFVYCSLDFKQRVRVKYSCIDKMWVGDVYKVKNELVCMKPSMKETNYPLKIGGTVVLYARDTYVIKRFKLTNKYKTILKWYDRYGNSNS